jgi:hypothetical protein
MAFNDLITSGIRAKLNSLKWSLRTHLFGNALVWIILALVAGVFLTLGIDYTLHMDRAQRGLIVLLTLVGIAYVVWRFLLRPLRVPMGEEELALVLENHYGDLDDRLISTLQFAAHDQTRLGASEVLIKKVADQAGELIGNLDASGPVESKRTWKRMSMPAAALIILVIYSVCYSQVMGLWFQRNVLFADTPWPQETYLSIEGGQEVDGKLQFRVVRGRSLNITVKANVNHVVPKEVTFRMDFPGLGTTGENVTGAGPDGNIYVKTFSNVAEPFEFYVTGNDDRTRDCHVKVVDPPELLDVRFKIYYPAYMKRPQSEIEFERGVLAVPPGSRVSLSGRANKPLAGARLLLDGKEVEKSLRLVSTDKMVKQSTNAELKGISGHFYLPERTKKSSMKLQFELTDTEGITNEHGATYAIRIDLDRPPSVSMNRTGVRADVTAKALIPLIIQGHDDCGVAGFELCVVTVLPSKTTTAPASAMKKIQVPGVPVTREVSVNYELDLEPMKLKIGSLVRIHTVVHDTMPESFGGPNTSKSLVQSFKIVSEQELMTELVRIQREISQEFIGTVMLQGQVKDKVHAIGDKLGSTGLDAEIRRGLSVAGMAQRQIAAQCATAAQKLGDVLDEMNYNRVGSQAEKLRLSEKIIQPLLEISKNSMINLGAELTRASKETSAATIGQITTDATKTLDGFYTELEKILEEMQQGIRRQELENHLKVIIEAGTRILEEIRKRAEKETGTVFDTPEKPEKE